MTVPQTNLIFHRSLLLLLFAFGSLVIRAQKNHLRGIIRDSVENKPLHYAIAALVDETDSSLYTAVRTNEQGAFEFGAVPKGKYTLLISYPRMADYLLPVTVTDTSKIDVGKINMITRAMLMEEVIVRSGQPIRMRGDTLEYTADSFAVRPGANVQELLKRLPGIQVDRLGKIIAQGKEVKKILVDGDEFFADDPKLVTQFLGADAIDKVQVFDKKSENTDFTGIDDGSRTKTINLQLKKNKKNGAFGKAATGSSGDGYYDHQAMASLFRESKKMSVFGLMSKTGKEGLSYNDLSQYVGQDYERIDDGSNSYYTTNDYENENYYGSGIPSVASGGAHYSNKWREGKEKLFVNYRIKQINATGWTTNNGISVLPDGSSFVSQNANTESSRNFNQKASGNFTTPVDSFSTLKISADGNLVNGNKNNNGNASSTNEKGFKVSESVNTNSSKWHNKKFSSNISYQRKFKKEGRTVSFIAQQELSDGNNDDYNYANNNYFDPATGAFAKADTLNQLQRTHNINQSYAARLNATESLSKEWRLSVEYGWKKVATGNSFNTYNNKNGKYTDLLDTLSNDYDFTLNTHIAGTMLSWRHNKTTITVGGKTFFTGFKQVDNSAKSITRRNFTNLAPQASVNIRLKENRSLSFGYNGETFQPSVEQLQPLRKSNNPLFVMLGNPDLSPGFNHTVSANYNNFNWQKGTSFYASLSANYVQNGISSNITTDAQNRNVLQYVNLQQHVPQLNGNASYSWQIKKLRLRPSIAISGALNGGNYILNGSIIQNKNYYGTLNPSLTYELENKLVVFYSGAVNYNKSSANIPGNSNRQTVNHTHTINVSKYFPYKIELTSDCTFNFQPANSSFNKSFNTVRWNAFVEKKFLKNDRAFARFSANDLLNGNTGYNRSINGANVDESNRLTIKRYFMVTLGWNFIKSL